MVAVYPVPQSIKNMARDTYPLVSHGTQNRQPGSLPLKWSDTRVFRDTYRANLMWEVRPDLTPLRVQPPHIQSCPGHPKPSLPEKLILHPVGIAMACDWWKLLQIPSCIWYFSRSSKLAPLQPPGISIPSQCNALRPRDFYGTNEQHAWVHMVLRASATPSRNR